MLQARHIPWKNRTCDCAALLAKQWPKVKGGRGDTPAAFMSWLCYLVADIERGTHRTGSDS